MSVTQGKIMMHIIIIHYYVLSEYQEGWCAGSQGQLEEEPPHHICPCWRTSHALT